MEKRHRRPFGVTLTGWGVLILGAGYCISALHAALSYSLLKSLPLSVPAWYFPLSGAFWGLVWLILGIGLLFEREWSRRAAMIAVPVLFLAWLADDRLLSRSAIALQSFGFEALIRLILAAIGFAVLLGLGRLSAAGAFPASAGSDASMEKSTTHAE